MGRIRLNDRQRQAAELLAGPLLIAAGAGSGKTRVLTERVVNAVLPEAVQGWDPADILGVLAITYTDKAAGELSERVRGALRAAGLLEQARRVDAAWISTIHGMCSRMLRADALELGIDPGFGVAGTVEGGRIREAAFEKVAREALERDEDVRRLIGTYGFSTVASIVFRLGDACRTARILPTTMSPERTRSPRDIAEVALSIQMEAREGFRTCGLESAAVDQQIESCSDLIGVLEELSDTPMRDSELAETLYRALARHADGGRAQGALKERIQQLRAAHADVCAQAAAAVTASFAGAATTLTEAWMNRIAEMKAEAGLLDFDDLQLEAARLLADPERAKRWAQRFRLTMVDEFQDTDDLQLTIVKALAGDNLCTVGDERQSIYRFRGADIGVFREHERAMEGQQAPRVELAENYRSHPHILGFVNRVFGSEELFGERLIRLKAEREEPEPPRVKPAMARVELMVAEQVGNARGPARELQANAIAAEVADMIDADTGITAGDIVVLLRAYTHGEEYAQALRDRGIDAVVVGGRRFFEQREVSALKSLVGCIANRRNEEALVALLASDIVGMPDDGLLELRRRVRDGEATTLWDGLEQGHIAGEAGTIAERARRAITAATQRVGASPLSEIVLRAIEDLGFDLRMMAAGSAGRQQYANVLKFARLADAFERTGGAGPAAFVSYLDAKERFREHEAPASLVGEGADAVRIMSVHSSKGLEFPVVILPELGEPGHNPTTPARWRLSPDPAIAFALPSDWAGSGERKTPLYAELDAEEKDAEAEEAMRLFYVACTRARERLILTGGKSFKSSNGKTWLNLLCRVLDPQLGEEEQLIELGNGAQCRYRTILPRTAGTQIQPPPDLTVDPGWTSALALTANLPREADLEPPKRLSYSGISAYRSCGLRFLSERVMGMSLPEQMSSTAATRLGTAVHAALQLLGEGEPLTAGMASRLASQHELDETQRTRLVSAVSAYQASELAREVKGYDTCRREAPFALRVGEGEDGFILAGEIDVYAASGERALIVDYKTGTADEGAEELESRYRLQAGCYAVAAFRDGRQSVEAVFVRPEAPERDGQPPQARFSFTAGDIERIEKELESEYARMRRGEYPARGEWSDSVCPSCPVPARMCDVKLGRDDDERQAS